MPDAEDRDSRFVLLARLVRTQGRHGELIADLLTDFPERFADRTSVWLLPRDTRTAPREATVERHWLHKGRIVLKFASVDSISDATLLSGWHVAVPRGQRTPLTDGALYISDLIGCHVINETAGADEAAGAVDLGPVLDVLRGDGDVLDMLVLKYDDDELLIPFAKAYLVAAELETRRLRMRLPAGLTSINASLTDEERAAQQRSREDS